MYFDWFEQNNFFLQSLGSPSRLNASRSVLTCASLQTHQRVDACFHNIGDDLLYMHNYDKLLAHCVRV